jgi:hypothetical protein
MNIVKRIAEHPEDFALRIEYAKQVFLQMSERCEHQTDNLCFHPNRAERITKCSVIKCPLMTD